MRERITHIVESYYRNAVNTLVLSYLLWLTLQPTDVRFTITDANLALVMEILVSTVIITILIQRLQCVKGQNGHSDVYLHVGWSDVFVLLWLVYYSSRAWFWTEYPCATEVLKGLTMFATYFVLRLFFTFYRPSARMLILCLLLFCGYEAIQGVFQLMNGGSNHMLFLITGTFYNPGPYSAYLVLGTVILLSMLHSESHGMYLLAFGKVKTNYFYYALLILTLLVLPATWSRSAFVALVVMCLWIYRDKYKRYRYYLWGVIVVVVIGLYFVKKGSADGRLFIWLSSLTSWLHSPWIGTGIGSFFHAEAEGTSELFASSGYMPLFHSADITNFMCNDYLKILLEQGAVGALLCALAAITMIVKLYRHCKPLCYGVAALLIFSMTSYPFDLLPYKLIGVLIAAWGNSLNVNPNPNSSPLEQGSRRGLQWGWKHCVVMSGMIILGCMFLKAEMEKRIEAEQSYQLFCNTGHEAFINDYYELLPLEHDNSSFLFDFGKLLRTFGKYNDSNAMFLKGTLVSNDPMFYILIGNNYKDLQFYDLSEKAYQKAYSIMPNRLYPLYQLMNLYHETGKRAESRRMARKIVDFQEKVTSPATGEMKEKARKMLRNQ